MRYFIRSVKYFLYFTVIFAAIVSLLVFTGAASGDISTMFVGGYSALWKIAAIFAFISAVYPAFGFMKKDVPVAGCWEEIKDEIIRLMESRGYVKETEDTGMMTFRKTGASRFARMYEDRIEMEARLGGVTVEGLRKDVLRIAMGLEHRFRNDGEQ